MPRFPMRKTLPLLSLLCLAACLALAVRVPPGTPLVAADDEAPPVVREAECRRAQARIKIDGVIDEVAWDKAQVLQGFSAFWDRRKAKSATKARLLWDDEYLYFCAEMEDVDLYADVKEHNGMCWTNDVFELFFKPAEDKLPYYEFQVNALNTVLEMYLPSRGAGGYQRFAPLGNLGMESAVKLDGTLNDWTDKDKGWTVEGVRGDRRPAQAGGEMALRPVPLRLLGGLRPAGPVLDGPADAVGLSQVRGLRRADVQGP